MIYNKQLSITDDMILSESDLAVLTRWRCSIESQITELVKDVDEWRKLTHRGKTKYKCLLTLKKILGKRIAAVKIELGYRSERSRRKDRTLAMLFMQKAKEMLDKETYSNILSAAQADKEE